MAPPVADPWGRWVGLGRELLAPSPGRLEMALRLAVICTVTALVGQVYQVPGLDLAVYVVFFLNKSDRMSGVVLAIALTIVLTLVLCLVFGVALLVLDHSFWLIVSIAVLSFGLLFIGSASKLGPLAGTIALIVGYGLDVLGTLPVGELATRAVLYGWLLIGLPAPISLLVNLLMAPSPRRLVQRDLAIRLRLAASLLCNPCAACRRQALEVLREGDVEMQKRLKLAKLERTSPATDLASLRQAAMSSVAILALAELADRDPASRLPAAIGGELAATLEAMAGIFASGGYPADVDAPCGAMPPADLSPRAAAVLRQMRDLLASFAVAPSIPSPPEVKAGGGFFQPDAFTNPRHVQYALKATTAALVAYILYNLLNWSGIHTIFITCYIVSLGTMAETIEKLSLRLTGAILGAAAGIGAIVWIVPMLSSIQHLLMLVFAGALAGGWVAAGSERVAYIGFQFAFAFFVSILQGSGPSFDMGAARDRVIGILLGNLISYFIFVYVWPVSVTGRIDRAIAQTLRKLPAMLAGWQPAGRLPALAAVQAEIGGIETDLRLAKLEPVSPRADERWIGHRRRAVDRMADLAGILLADPAVPGDVERRLSGLADRLDPVASVMAGHPSADDTASPFGPDVARYLDCLEADLAPSVMTPSESTALVAA